MPCSTLRTMLLLSALCGTVAAQPTAPAAYPSFEGQATSTFVVVGDFGKGHHYPERKHECPQGMVCIAMSPPPFWFELKVIDTIYGDAPPAQFIASTGSHYGTQDFGTGAPYLAKFQTNGREFVMPRYTRTSLARKKNGELHLVVLSARPIFWLPCDIDRLREDIASEDFVDDLEVSGEALEREVRRDNAALYNRTEKGAVPKYAISMRRLQAHLRGLREEDLACDTQPRS